MPNESKSPEQPTAPATVASLEDVDRRGELLSRPQRPPSHEAVSRAFVRFAESMAADPRIMLHALVEAAVDLCGADTAGISLLDGGVVRWAALAGACADRRDGTMPRDASPCGVCIDEDTTQLMHRPDRRFPALPKDPPFVEVLVVPFHAHGRPVGTMWVVAHTVDRRFDAEDERLLQLLGRIASAGWPPCKEYPAAPEAARPRDHFLAMLSHELRNALGGLSLAVAMGRRDPAQRDRALELAGRQCTHLVRLVDDVLDVARMVEGKIRLNREMVAIEDVVDQAVLNSEALIAQRRHALSVSLPETRLQVDADRVRLVQIVTNLLVNAAKYTPSGGRIDLVAERRDAGVVLTVRDTGVGIAETMLPHVFELFAQASVECASGGLGIGLAIVKRLVELHGGLVAAQSDGLGKGSTFSVQLPMAASVGWTHAVHAPRSLRPPHAVRVLLVDDDVDTAETMATVLGFVGHEVRVVHDGDAALDALGRFAADAVVIDIGLPTIDGYEVARRLRELDAMDTVVLVAVTGYGTAADAHRALAAGFQYHLVKPVDFDRLHEALCLPVETTRASRVAACRSARAGAARYSA